MLYCLVMVARIAALQASAAQVDPTLPWLRELGEKWPWLVAPIAIVVIMQRGAKEAVREARDDNREAMDGMLSVCEAAISTSKYDPTEAAKIIQAAKERNNRGRRIKK